jgi:hypothetical protein
LGRHCLRISSTATKPSSATCWHCVFSIGRSDGYVCTIFFVGAMSIDLNGIDREAQEGHIRAAVYLPSNSVRKDVLGAPCFLALGGKGNSCSFGGDVTGPGCDSLPEAVCVTRAFQHRVRFHSLM